MKRTYHFAIDSNDQAGILNRITAVFSRVNLNIEALSVCETAQRGVVHRHAAVAVLPVIVTQRPNQFIPGRIGRFRGFDDCNHARALSRFAFSFQCFHFALVQITQTPTQVVDLVL